MRAGGRGATRGSSMRSETITQRDDLVIRRLVLEPGEATPWHTDSCHRFSVVVRGEALRIEFQATGERIAVAVQPGLAEWDTPEPRVHRALNTGAGAYEEVVLFFRPDPSVDPQPAPAQPSFSMPCGSDAGAPTAPVRAGICNVL